VPSFHLKFDVLSFFQAVKLKTLEAAAMEEHLLAVRGANETEAAIANDPFNCSLHIYLDPREDGRALARFKNERRGRGSLRSVSYAGLRTLPTPHCFVKRQFSSLFCPLAPGYLLAAIIKPSGNAPNCPIWPGQ